MWRWSLRERWPEWRVEEESKGGLSGEWRVEEESKGGLSGEWRRTVKVA